MGLGVYVFISMYCYMYVYSNKPYEAGGLCLYLDVLLYVCILLSADMLCVSHFTTIVQLW